MREKIREWIDDPLLKCVLVGVAIANAILFVLAAIFAFAYGLCENAWALLAVIPCALICGASIGFAVGLDEV